jgi:Xaa-Pro aminopeptidase
VENGLDGALILQKADLYYFASTVQQSNLYIPAEGSPLLLVRKSLARAKAESGLANILPLGSLKTLPDLLRENGHKNLQRIGMELDVLPVNLYLRYQKILAPSEICDISLAIRLLRAVKSDHEIELICKAAECADKVAAQVPHILRLNMTEIEFAGQVEAYARRLGHQGIVRMRLWGSELFYGHIMSGPSAAGPSYLSSLTGGQSTSPAIAQGPGSKRIQKNEPILVDYVFAHQGYIADHTRIFCIGNVPGDLARGHQCMLEIQEMVKQMAVPGIPCGRLYDAAVAKAAAQGVGDFFMGADEQRIRFVGHGVGLELDEFPFLAEGQKLKLQEKMVIALEPKLVFPGHGVVGIENTHLVTQNGLSQLTKLKESIHVIEG